ncbi:MAG: anaerobic ribonucleoside-triphosphate reductase [Candidatus Brocadiia bacterium]|jgi:ribonucleoside-triphosphate reductase
MRVNIIREVRKRSGQLVPFNQEKIANAIFKAAQAVGGEDRQMADELADVVTMFLEKQYGPSETGGVAGAPTIEEIQDMVEKVLIETGHAKTAKAYILYRERRARIRDTVKVRKQIAGRNNPTDLSLLVDPATRDEIRSWNKQLIALALEKEADVPAPVAAEIASAVEGRILASGMKRISTSLIRELVDNELFERGLRNSLEKQLSIGMPIFDLEQVIFSKSNENSNIASNNPEAINLTIAENTLKQYALKKIFSKDVAEAHLQGMVHLHDLGYPTRVYCSSHSLEYLKKYGLSLLNLDTHSAPAKHARTLTGHLNTFLASMQAFYAGALGVGYINILYAPYLENLDDKTMRQEAQHLIFSGSQSAFSRGGQTLFLDFNVHTGVPRYMRDIPAIGPGGVETGRTYGDYEETAMRFTRALLDVWRRGDSNGHVFAFPKCDLHVNAETFSDPRQLELLEYACQAASENGTPYFVFDRDEVTLSACCRLRTTIEDNYMLRHLESMRFCGFQNITVNLPQAAYRAGPGNLEGLYREIDRAMEIAFKAHYQKRTFVQRLMAGPTMPLWQIGKTADDGRPYVDLDKCTYIVGLIGLNECLQHLTGQELHESDAVFKLGLKIVTYMHFRCKEEGKKSGLKFALEESPAESAARRLAKIDLRRYPQAEKVVRGSIADDEMYYTNSIHLRADAPVDLITRIRMQSKFHPLIESGAIIHAFVGEERPSPASVLALIRKTFENTQAAQLTLSPEFTVCNSCQRVTPQLTDHCAFCNSTSVAGMTRIVGYYSRVNNWNKSKIGELKDRHRGNYRLAGAPVEARTAPAATGILQPAHA